MEVLGSSGYAGVELLRLLASHPRAEVAALTSTDRNTGNGMGDVFAQFAFGGGPALSRLWVHEDVADWRSVAEVVFRCLPHATTRAINKGLAWGGRLEGCGFESDFRLRDV
jgi:N-acetyl-gamma-glutamyl-phosphate reductase